MLALLFKEYPTRSLNCLKCHFRGWFSAAFLLLEHFCRAGRSDGIAAKTIMVSYAQHGMVLKPLPPIEAF